MPRTLLSAHDVVRAIGPRTILSSVSLAVDDASRIALIGPNGSGKSTLLRALADAEPLDCGRVVRARDATALYLPQLDTDSDPRPVRAILHERLGVAGAATTMDALAARLAAGEDVVEAHAAALESWLALGGDDLDARLDRAAADGGLDPQLLSRPAAQLSGGQRARAMLAALGAARADVLLLDEPANHLDADGLLRLTSLLRARTGGLVLVAHDRTLLAAVTNRVVALDPHDGSATEYGGGWTAYETERDRALTRAAQAHDEAVAERDRLRARERSMRGRAGPAQGRASTENDKHIRHAMRQSAQRSADGLAAGIARRAARVEIPDKPWERSDPALQYAAGASRAGVVAQLSGAVLRRGAFSLGPLDLTVADGDRIRLAGPNGCGKSTVIAALTGRLTPVAGEVRHVTGAVAEVGQERTWLLDVAHRSGGDATNAGSVARSHRTPRDVVAAVRAHTGLGEREARAALAAMGLDEQLVARPVATLSPGERTRAELAAATAAGARLLVLDEPTNHLDVEALQALEVALDAWPGALVVATHDVRLSAGLRLDQTVDVAALTARLRS